MRSRLVKVLLVVAFGSPLGQVIYGLDIGDVVVTTKEMTSSLFVPGTGDAGEANQFWTIPAQSKLTVIGTRQEEQSWYKVSGDQWVEEKQLGGNYRLVYRANRAKPSGVTPAIVTETEQVTKLSGAPGVHDTLVTTKPLTSYIHPNINPEVGNEVFIIPVKTIVDVLAIVRYRSNWCQLEVGEYSPRWIEEKELVGGFTPCPPEVIAERNRLREAENARLREQHARETEERARQQAAQAVQVTQDESTTGIGNSDNCSFYTIRDQMQSMTDIQFKQYAQQLEGKVVTWVGWVEESRKKWFGGYECWIDMDAPNELSVQDVTFDISESAALALRKDGRVQFTGTIKSARDILGSLQVNLVNGQIW